MVKSKLLTGGHYIDMKTFEEEAEAVQYMRTINKARKKANNNDIVVLVDGPADGEFTVMELKEAIESGFAYRWEI